MAPVGGDVAEDDRDDFGMIESLTNRWSQPLAVVKSTFDFMKPFSIFATLAAASGGSAPSR
jgi:hypothetical protein